MNSRFLGLLTATLVFAGISSAGGGIIAAGPITGGDRLTNANSSDGAAADTVIGSAPVTGDGVLDTVTFGWSSSGGCSAVKIKVFRIDGANIDFVGERGPIAATANVAGAISLTTAPLSPPIAVQRGDYLGITGANAGDCGNPTGQDPGAGSSIEYSGDVHSSVPIASGTQSPGVALALFASGSGNGETFAGILAGTGSLHGAQGSNFKTGLQVTNPYFSTVIGHVVFHPVGQSAGPNDPSLGFSLDPGNTGSLDDIIAEMGLSGLWSADLYMGHGDSTPIVVARIFNDAGAGGTTGFTESLIDPTKVTGGPSVSVTGVLIAPPDFQKYRLNIGIRTIGGPVGISVSVKDPGGNVIHTFEKVYAADAFFQLSANEFLGGFDPGANDTLVITYSGGGAIIYGATTDNVTNDPSVQFMPFVFAIA